MAIVLILHLDLKLNHFKIFKNMKVITLKVVGGECLVLYLYLKSLLPFKKIHPEIDLSHAWLNVPICKRCKRKDIGLRM